MTGTSRTGLTQLVRDHQNPGVSRQSRCLTKGLQVLEQLLGQSVAQVGVLPIEWSVFQQQSSFISVRSLILRVEAEFKA